MAASSSSAAAAEPRLPKHDVFLSFRGEDTRKKFTSHLYASLCEKQIGVYIDQVSLEQGSEISPELLKAIEESEISIIIFSEDYASSSWCLDEVVHILKCKKEKDRIVLPIFIDIDPSHIRKQRGSYAAAFEKHEKHFNSEKAREWRQALTEAAGLSGWDSRNRAESDIVKEVVKHVRTKLDTIKSKRSEDLKGVVGMPKRLVKIKSFLDKPNVRIIGIWGMGGIGKTTLAQALFNRLYNDFDGSCFAPNVRENEIKKGLDSLKTAIFSKLLGETNLDTFKSDVDDRLSRKSILLVLDDVETPMQLKHLVGNPDRFGPGSKIIVTSRHKLKVDQEYEVEALGLDDACKLFYLNAFPDKSRTRGEYKEISDKVVEYTKGHPLALEVLGASVFYFCESIEDWKKELEKLKRIPNDEIQKVLKISYDALDAEQKGLFLDIACFFKGQQRDFVEGLLEDKPIAGLINKSLITIECDRIGMHDLIQEMGRAIVRQSTDKLGERSRLWIADEVSYVLENNKGTEAIEGIYLPWIEEELHLRPDVFQEMCRVRFLKICPSFNIKVYIDGDLKYLPNGLRYLHWEDYPGKSLPSKFKPQNLVELNMPYSNLEQLWDDVQKLESLKHINLQSSELLTKIPDLSLASKLESINLLGCCNLITLPKVCGNLQVLLLNGSGIEQIPASSVECLSSLQGLSSHSSNKWKLKAPEKIDLSRNLPEIENQSEHLWKLNLLHTPIQKLPSSIENLIQLRDLNLNRCQHLEFIPKTLCKLTRLKQLSLSCSKLESFPMLRGMRSLTYLYLVECNIREIPDWLESLTSLVSLSLAGNVFERIPSSIGKLNKLTRLNISKCKNLRSLPELPLSIQSLDAHDCSSLEMVSTSRSRLTWKRWLDNYDCLRICQREFREFSFLNCSKLNENAINNIFTEFRSKVFCIATTPQEVVKSKGIIPGVFVHYPGRKIPIWFDYQSEGSSIRIKLPPNWYHPKMFLGFVVFVVEKTFDRGYHESFECRLYLEAKHRVSLEVDLSLDMDGFYSERSDHVLMWYKCFDHSKVNFEQYQEALFMFIGRPSCEVNRCGVRMLYFQTPISADWESLWSSNAIFPNSDKCCFGRDSNVFEKEAAGSRPCKIIKKELFEKEAVGSKPCGSVERRPLRRKRQEAGHAKSSKRSYLRRKQAMRKRKKEVFEKEAVGSKQSVKVADEDYQSRGSEIIESDSDEPPPKRTQKSGNFFQGSSSGKEN